MDGIKEEFKLQDLATHDVPARERDYNIGFAPEPFKICKRTVFSPYNLSS
jgi:hypothetical protein